MDKNVDPLQCCTFNRAYHAQLAPNHRARKLQDGSSRAAARGPAAAGCLPSASARCQRGYCSATRRRQHHSPCQFLSEQTVKNTLFLLPGGNSWHGPKKAYKQTTINYNAAKHLPTKKGLSTKSNHDNNSDQRLAGTKVELPNFTQCCLVLKRMVMRTMGQVVAVATVASARAINKCNEHALFWIGLVLSNKHVMGKYPALKLQASS
jgi:hypothetical protein